MREGRQATGSYQTHLAAMPGVESFSYDGPASHLGRHAHDEIQLTLYDGGPHRFEVSGSATYGAPHCAVLIQAGELHSSRPAGHEPIHLRGFYITVDALESIAGSLWEGHGTVTFSNVIIDDAKVLGGLRSAHSALASNDVGAHERFIAAMATLLERCGRARGALRRVQGARSNVERVRDYLRAHAVDDLTLETLAALAGLSRYHLIRAFRDAYGMTPFAYQRRLRIQRARLVLAEGGAIRDAVVAGRFADRSHFGRQFLACYGVSPGMYRDSFARRSPASP